MNWPNLGRMVGAAVLYAFAAGSVVQAEPPSGKAGVTEAGKRPERTPNMSEAQTIVSARPHEDVRAAEALQKPELDAIANTCVRGVYTDPDGRANTSRSIRRSAPLPAGNTLFTSRGSRAERRARFVCLHPRPTMADAITWSSERARASHTAQT